MASKDVGKLRVILEAQTQRFEREIAKARKANERFSKSIKRSATSAQLLQKAMRRFAPLAVAATFTSMARNAINAADALAKASVRIGFTIEELEGLRFAASEASIDVRTLDMAMQRFSRRTGEIALGGGELKETFESLGIAVAGADGKMRANADLLVEFAQKVQAVESPQQRLALAFKAFDSEGAAVLQLLPSLVGGFDQLNQVTSETVGIVGEANVKALERAGNAMDRFTKRVSNAAQTFGGWLVDTLNLAPTLEQRIADLREEIRQTAEIMATLDPAGRIFEQQALTGKLEELAALELQRLGRIEAQNNAIARQSELAELLNRSRERAGRTETPSEALGMTDRQFFRYQQLQQNIRDEATETQAVIADGAEAAGQRFSSAIAQAVTEGKFSFKSFTKAIASDIANLFARALVVKFITGPLLGALGLGPAAANAQGGAFSKGVKRFAAGGVVSGPTLFPMASGAGLMGEAGPEAVLPLARDPRSGDLGVKVAGGGGGAFAPTVVVNVEAPQGQDPNETGQIIGAALKRQLAEMWRAQAKREQAPGGVLAGRPA